MPSFQMHPDNIFESFENQRIMVVGDIMLDRYITGQATRISPEAPVPVLNFHDEQNRLGGAANVALNIKALGATPVLCGFLGQDSDGLEFLKILEAEGVSSYGVISSSDRMTTVKSRIIAGKQQLLRLDKENTHELSSKDTSLMFERVVDLMDSELITGLIFQDYNKGVLTVEVVKKIIADAKKRSIPISVDPKFRNFWSYQGVNLFKPNLKEVQDALGLQVPVARESLKQASKVIQSKLNCDQVLITLSEKGVFIDDGENWDIHPTKSRTVADVCGAGDTVISVAALALSVGLSGPEIAMLANLAGGQVVEKNGVVTVNKEQLRDELIHALMEV